MMNTDYDNNMANTINGFPDEHILPVKTDPDEPADTKQLIDSPRFGISDLWKIRSTRKIFRYYR